MYFYDLTFDDNKMVFPEYMIGQIAILNKDFTIDKTLFDESHYGRLFLGVFALPDQYIFSIHESRIIRKYVKNSKSFVDVEIKDLPTETEVRFKHDDVFVSEDRIIVINFDNEIFVSDLTFSDIKYVKSIYKGKPHMQIAEDAECLYVPIDKTIFSVSKNELGIGVHAELDQAIEAVFINNQGLWALTNDAKLTNLNDGNVTIDLSSYIHFYGNRENGQINNFINAYCYKEKVLLVPCYCDNLLLMDAISHEINELVIEKEMEDKDTLAREGRNNMQKYIASCQKEQYVYFLSSSSEILYSFDFESVSLKECPRGINGKSLIEIELRHKKFLREQSNGINLKNYIEFIAEQ